jgi:asparagine synthase (glutamine-hydrolysing)
MDSSAIVCVADAIARNDGCPPIETVSYFDDGEPNWNERPYFTAVEAQRGRTGLHLNVAGSGRFFSERDGTFPVTPAHGSRPSEAHNRFAQYLSEGGFRVLLSGTGGDEFTGGVPTGTPELADLLSRAQLGRFLHRAFLWAMASRKPLLHEVGQVVRTFLPASWATNTVPRWPMPWLNRSFVRCNQETLTRNSTRFHWLGPLPTFQENLHALDRLRRQIACAEIPPTSFCQMRYPFLDRDLLEFLFNAPRDQLVRPNQRRSLLRRALRGIVPSVVLDRRRKAFVVTSQLKTIAAEWKSVSAVTERMVLESRDILDSAVLRQTLEKARHGDEVPLLPIMRALRLEQWLQDPEIQGLFSAPPERECVHDSSQVFSAEKALKT